MGRQFGFGVVAVVAILVAGCGQAGGGSSDQLQIRTITDTTESAGTARFEGSYQPSGRDDASAGGTFVGEVDFANHRSAMRSRMQAEGKRGPYDSETRIVDGYTYFKVPPDGTADIGTDASKPWSRLKLPGTSSMLLPMGGTVDVTGYLKVLEAIGARSEVTGSDEVRGVPTTRYRVVLEDPPDLPAQVKATGNISFGEPGDGFVYLWADGQGRLRRLRAEFGHDDSGSHRGGGYQLEVFDFGAPVTVEAPPPDQVSVPSDPFPDSDSYEQVASGTADGARWKLFAGTQGDASCVSVEADIARYYSTLIGAEHGRIDLGCTSSASASVSSSGETSIDVPGSTFDGFDPQAVPLADGRALLVSAVPERTTKITLRLRDGGARTASSSNGWLVAALGHDDVVTDIEFVTPSRTRRCRLEGKFGYDCEAGSGGDASVTYGSDSAGSAVTAVPTTAPR